MLHEHYITTLQLITQLPEPLPPLCLSLSLLSAILSSNIEHSPTWEANSSSGSQEIPRILWNQKCYYHLHNNVQNFPILNQICPVYLVTSSFLKIHFNIILPSLLISCRFLFPLYFPAKI